MCAYKKLLWNSDFRCQWKWFTYPNMMTRTYLQGTIKPPTFFFKSQHFSIVRICCNSRTNYKIVQKSYAVIIGIMWFWKIKTFWKCCTCFPWSVAHYNSWGLPHRHGFKESKNHNIILICAHMAWISYFSGACKMCLVGDIKVRVYYSLSGNVHLRLWHPNYCLCFTWNAGFSL